MKRICIFLCLFVFAASGCGKKNSLPTQPSSQQPLEPPDSSPQKSPPPKRDHEPLSPPEMKDFLAISQAIEREVQGINFGSKDNPLWGQPEWVYYYKPWQKNEKNWYARVKTHLPNDLGDSPFLVWCHYHGKQMVCHKSSKSSKDELGDEPLDKDFPHDQPKNIDDDCNPIEDEDCEI